MACVSWTQLGLLQFTVSPFYRSIVLCIHPPRNLRTVGKYVHWWHRNSEEKSENETQFGNKLIIFHKIKSMLLTQSNKTKNLTSYNLTTAEDIENKYLEMDYYFNFRTQSVSSTSFFTDLMRDNHFDSVVD